MSTVFFLPHAAALSDALCQQGYGVVLAQTSLLSALAAKCLSYADLQFLVAVHLVEYTLTLTPFALRCFGRAEELLVGLLVALSVPF